MSAKQSTLTVQHFDGLKILSCCMFQSADDDLDSMRHFSADFSANNLGNIRQEILSRWGRLM